MSFIEATAAVGKKALSVVRSAPSENDIGDEQFIKDLKKLKDLRSFLIEQAVQLQPSESSTISFKKLNLLRYRDDGRFPTEEEWEQLEQLTQNLFRHLSDPLRRRFLFSRTPGWFAPLMVCLGLTAIASLVILVFIAPSAKTHEIVLLFSIWVGSLGAIGSVAFIGMNALSVQDDATFDLGNNRLLILRIALGALFGIMLTLPFGWDSFMKFIGSLLSASGTRGVEQGTAIESAMLLLPFVLGFSTTLVIMILNQFVEAIQSFFGKKATSAPAAGQPKPGA